MHQAFNEPTLCCLIEVSSPGQGLLFHFRIDQAIPLPKGEKQRQSVLSQVESHLNYLQGRTGLVYHMIYWSDPVRFTAYLREHSIELS